VTAPLLSPDWYRVSFLRPRLRAGLRVTRQTVRGQPWLVVTDPLSGRHHRFNLMAWQLVASCDGRRNLDEVWSALVDASDDEAPTQAEAIEIIGRAFNGHLLLGNVPPDAAAVVRVTRKARGRKRREAVNPLAFRIPIWDPDDFLQRHLGRVRWVFARAVLRTLAVLIALAGATFLIHADAFADDVARQFSDMRGLLLLWLAYPVVKGLHELAHAFAVRHYGGEVHAMGVTLLFLTPVPYVDASASAAFPSKHQRALVAGAGIATELLLAGAALALWLALEPGLLREAAAAIVVVGGVSTLLLNGNPLLRFDGYHVLCDLAELPNLAQRSRGFWLHQIRRHAMGVPGAGFAGVAPGERPWLLGYAPLAWLYRCVLLFVLAAALMDPYPWLGLLLALAALWLTVVGPLAKGLYWVLQSPQLAHRRPRALAVVLAGAGLASVVAFALPLPQRSHAPGVVSLPDEAGVRLQVGGFVEAFVVRDGQRVARGDVLARLSNPPLLSQIVQQRAELQRAQVEEAQQRDLNPSAAAQVRDRIAQIESELGVLERQRDALEVRATSAGRVAFDVHRDLVGMYLPQGHLLAQVLTDAAPLVRAMVDNADIGLVRARTEAARVTLADGAPDLAATVAAAMPQATTALPSAALGTAAGGSIAVDPEDASGMTARAPRFQVDLKLPDDARPPIGARVLVTFDHGAATGADWLARALRRAFLRHLSA
jgi:putative peptide zinc metalloprotease protein